VYKNFQRAIRTDPYKLIEYNVGGTITKQLFDLSKDPYEINNLSGQAGSDSLIIALESEMQAALRDIGDEADLALSGWGVPVIMSWEEKIRRSDPEMLENLREMAAKEHKD
jgi:hypothetical protein